MCCETSSLREWRRTLAVLCVSTLSLLSAARASAQPPVDYVIGPQDVLAIAVWDQSDLAGKFAVETDGTFTFPLIGRVKAGGLSLREVEAELIRRLKDGFFVNPQVTVAIEQYRSQRVFVVGEVRMPGPQSLTGDMTLVEALSRAGSTLPSAGDEAVIVRPPAGGAGIPLVLPPASSGTAAGGSGRRSGGREGSSAVPPGGQSDGGYPSGGSSPTGGTDDGTSDAFIAQAMATQAEVIRVDIRDLQRGVLAQNVRLRDGDTVFVPRAPTIFVFGQVRNAGEYPIKSETTVLQALSLAGGVTDRGSTGRIRIVRIVNGKKTEVRAGLGDRVQPGDTIIVLERFL